MAENGATSEEEFWQSLRDSKKPAVPTAELAEAIEAPVSDEYKAVRKELWQSAGWFTLWAIGNFLSGNVSFALALMVIALLTYRLPSVAMFAIHGLFFLWAAATNLLNFPGGSGLFWAIVLIVSCFVELRRFFRHRQLVEESAAWPLPWLALAAGAAGLLGWLVMWLWLFAWGAVNANAGPAAAPPSFIPLLLWLSADVGALGLAMGLTALLLRYPYKAASAAGVVAGGLVMFMALFFLLFFAS